ncbi:MAG: VOC family protein [Deltaproteobacteria bacterium]|nr:VOC family protein [Deltaproteobacteria bacterium]MBW2362065.1 VOC family protein [Deltaproteobacteria bacterium]
MGEDWELNHVGLMVTNRDAALGHFQNLGIGVSVGPQPLLPHEDGQGSLTYYRTLKGDPVTHTYPTGGAHNFRDGESQIGDCQLECYAMRPGPGMFISEYLAEKGPGINHICFNAHDVEADTRMLLGKDCDLVFNASVNGRTSENYLDTREHGDLMISLRPPSTEWEKAWKANNEAHPLVQGWRFLGVGLGVDSADASVAYYESLGFRAVGEATEDAQLAIRSRAVRVGPLVLEFSEATDDDSICADSLARRGEGVNDIAFEVVDLEAEQARLLARGAELLRRSEDGKTLYVDTRAEGNIMLRLVQG